VSLPNVNFITNKLAVKERWLKLYRKIHNLFLVKEFVHVDDYKLMLEQLNTRITAVETNMAAGDAAVTAALNSSTTSIYTAISGHIHIAPQAPSGAIPTSPPTPPPVAPPIPPAPAPTTPIIKYTDVALQTYDAALKGMGPAIAPIGDGLSTETAVANVTAKSDVGI